MSSGSRAPWLEFDAIAAPTVEPVRARLATICADARAHPRFLNMLSLMEHIGSRKIMASQSESSLRQDTLKHMAEETRHAFFFKRAAEKLAGRSLDYSDTDTMAGVAARMYMGRLDAEIAQELPARRARELAYLYMSLIVELRAIWFYRLYQSVLSTGGAVLSLTSLLAEEQAHLDAILAEVMRLDDNAPARLAQFCAFEDARFRVLWAAVETASGRDALAAE